MKNANDFNVDAQLESMKVNFENEAMENFFRKDGEEYYYDGDLLITEETIFDMPEWPNQLTINGNFVIDTTYIIGLPEIVNVEGSFYAQYCQFAGFPKMTVKGNSIFHQTNIKKISDLPEECNFIGGVEIEN